eukprot:scaffold186_cov129-Skeletonema_menzelii.AAC.3
MATTSFEVGVTTLTNVTALSNIALDVRDMAVNLKAGNLLAAQRVYTQGANSVIYDIFGRETLDKLTLKSMGQAGGDEWIDNPSFTFQMLGLSSVQDSAEEAITKHANYADYYISTLLNDQLTAGNAAAAQASTILTVHMNAMHKLWDGFIDCTLVQKGYNPEEDQTGKINPKRKYDEFIALYVGAGQTLGPSWEGFLLYALAQAASKPFDTVDENGEALVNKDIRGLYEWVQRIMSEEDYCTRDESISELWTINNRIIAKMNLSMMQMLINAMHDENQFYLVPIYARAIIPQLSQCRTSIQRKLKSYLLDKEYEREDFSRILPLLQQTYDCLGFTCEQIGAYSDKVAECGDYTENHPLAGFVPKADVQTISKVDLDMHAIRQLLKFPTGDDNIIPQMYYKHGRAAVINEDKYGYDVLSLQEMARSSIVEKWSPYYSDFVSYHGKEFYADSVIMNEFKRNAGTDTQQDALLLSWMQFGVVTEYLMGLLGSSDQMCENANNDDPTKYWDAFAATYIGSLEGIDLGGSDQTIDGFMLWNVANRRAVSFDTQNDDYYAEINDEMLELLFAGQAQLLRKDCLNFEKTVSRTLHLMVVPLVQSVIWYAIKNEGLDASSNDDGLVIGEVAAKSVLPIVKKFDPNAARIIERNMVSSEVNFVPVVDGPQAVANAFYLVLDEIGWGCDYVGHADGVEACQLESTRPRSNNGGSVKQGAVIILALLGVLSAWLY